MPLGPTLVIVGDTVVTGGDVPVMERGDDGSGIATVGAGLIVIGDDGTGAMLIPPSPICTEPNGILVGEIALGEEDDIAADDDGAPLALAPHVPDVAALPGNGVPVPIPNPPPSKFVLEPDASADGLPMAAHVVAIIPLASVSAGLSPGDASSVAPMGRPTGGTGEPDVMPSGEVVPIPGVGLPIPPTCAKTGLQLNNAAAVAAINARRIVISVFLARRLAGSSRPFQPLCVRFPRSRRPSHLGNAFSSPRHAADELIRPAAMPDQAARRVS